MKKPMELADQLVREHADLPACEHAVLAAKFGEAARTLREALTIEKNMADRIADTVTRVKHVRRCVQFHLNGGPWSALVARDSNGDYTAITTVSIDHTEAWSIPENERQRTITREVVAYCRAHDAEIRLAIDAALAPGPIAAHGGGTNEDSLDADWKDDAEEDR